MKSKHPVQCASFIAPYSLTPHQIYNCLQAHITSSSKPRHNMTELSINAVRFSSSIELDVLVVGFLMDAGDYVLFQQGLTEGAGLNEPPYFEHNDPQYGGYCLIKSCVLTRSQVVIELTRPLNGITKLLIGIAGLDADYQDIVEQMGKIFIGDKTVLSIAAT
jgi:hypothetical protein